MLEIFLVVFEPLNYFILVSFGSIKSLPPLDKGMFVENWLGFGFKTVPPREYPRKGKDCIKV